jgi:hypothetical protein
MVASSAVGPDWAEDPPGTAPARVWAYVALLVSVVVAAGLSQTPLGQALLRAVGVVASGTGYTELAFVAPGSLPQRLATKTTLRGPPFMIHNRTGQGLDYRWTVTVTSHGSAQPEATGTTALTNGAHLIVAPTLQLHCAPGPMTVTVQLSGSVSGARTESVGFHATCTRSTPTAKGHK